MSIAVWIGVGAAIAAGVIIGWTARALRAGRSSLPPELVARRAQLKATLREVVAGLEGRPAAVPGGELPEHPATAKVEARLLSDDAAGAIAAAERAVATHADEPAANLLLARALVAAGEFTAARHVLERAESLGARGPMLAFLRGRVLQGRAESARGDAAAGGEVPPLVTPFEMLVLQLERQRRVSDRAAAIWLASATGEHETLTHDQIRDVVVEHFHASYTVLGLFLDAARGAPAFADALYHAGRLALKIGFVDDGRALFEAIEPLMEASSEERFYRRDLAALRDEPDLLTGRAAPSAPPEAGPRAVRSKSLKVLP